MPDMNSNSEETVFSAAFNEAARKRPRQYAALPEQAEEDKTAEAEDAKPAAPGAETMPEGEENACPEECPPAALEGDTSGKAEDGGAEPEPDFKSLYDREVQRFRSFEGRYRKEKQAWERERRDLMNLLEREPGRPSPAEQGRAAGSEATPPAAGNLAGAGSEPRLAEVVRRETARVLEPLMAGIEAERHRSAVAAAHPDFEEVAADPDLSAWIDEQPDYIARVLRDVVDRGSAGEVIDLLDRYKQDRSRRNAGDAAEKNRAKAERKAREAAAVRSRSAGPPRERASADDFAGAWAEAVRKGL